MVFSEKIDKILSVGINLHDSQIHNWALTKDQALEVLDKFDDAKISVLGGDVMDNINGEMGFSGAGWHSDREKDETYDDFVKRSIKKAREYIVKYPASQTDDVYFTIVPG
ncbi:MAG: Imm40 family immunity protein [Chitinophaga sp.]